MDFTVYYDDGDDEYFEDAPCFGPLSSICESWQGEGCEATSVCYHSLTDFDDIHHRLAKWLRHESIFSGLYNSINDDEVVVRCDCPADDMLGALSLARTCLGSNRIDAQNTIHDLNSIGFDLKWSVWLTEMCLSGYAFHYKEEGLVQDWSIKEFLHFMDNLERVGNEPFFSTEKTYRGLKTSINKDVEEGHWEVERYIRLPILLNFLRYEGIYP